MTHEIEEDRLDRKNDREKENPYQSILINDFEKINVNINTLKYSNGIYLIMFQIMISTIGVQ